MIQPTLSVLMPVYNSEKYLAKTIESVLMQSFADFELLICNDASSDSSKAIILQFADSRIKYLENERNLGIVETRNKLFKHAQGEFCAILDSDDIALPQRFAKQVAFLRRNHEYGICGSWAKKITADDQVTGYIQMPVSHNDICINLLFQSSLVQSSICLRTLLIKDESYDREYTVAEDYDLWERLSHKTKLHNLPEYLVHYRWHDINISQQKKQLMIAKRTTIVLRQLQRLISPTAAELKAHDQFGNLSYLSPKEFKHSANDICNWLEKLISSNKQRKLYPQSRFVGFLWYRWIFFCAYHNQYKAALNFKHASVSPQILWHTLSLLARKASSTLS